MTTVRFSGYAGQPAAIQTRTTLSPQATTVSLQHGPSSDKFTLTSSLPAHAEPHFSGFRQGGRFYHGDPRGENRLCSENYNASGRCEGNSDESSPESEVDDEWAGATAVAEPEPRARLASMLPAGMRRPAARATRAATAGTARLGEAAGGVLQNTTNHQIGLIKDFMDATKYSWITTLADTIGMEKPENQAPSAWAAEILRIARKATPEMETEWQTRHDKAFREGRADLLLDHGFLSRLKTKIAEKIEHKTLQQINPDVPRENAKSLPVSHRINQEKILRVPTKGHRDRHNAREADKAARKVVAETASSIPIANRVASANGNETFRDSRDNEYRFSADGRQIVYLSDERNHRVTIPPARTATAPATTQAAADDESSGNEDPPSRSKKSHHRKHHGRVHSGHTRRTATTTEDQRYRENYDRSRYDGGDDDYYGGRR